MAELSGSSVRQFVGKPIHVALSGDRVVDGYLVSFDGRSLWIVIDGEDRFVPLGQVEDLMLRTAAVPLAG
ncbi:MAG: hypothetical protein ACRDZ3_19890 [Acidimicrobiia bacterium]